MVGHEEEVEVASGALLVSTTLLECSVLLNAVGIGNRGALASIGRLQMLVALQKGIQVKGEINSIRTKFKDLHYIMLPLACVSVGY